MDRKVLVVTVPADEGSDIVDMRDYIMESLRMGVLILGKGVTWEIVDMPELGGVSIDVSGRVPSQVDDGSGPGEEEGKPQSVKFRGGGAAEKRRILERLQIWRKVHGLGSFQCLIDASDGWLTDSVLRIALCGGKLDIETWRQIDHAINLTEG